MRQPAIETKARCLLAAETPCCDRHQHLRITDYQRITQITNAHQRDIGIWPPTELADCNNDFWRSGGDRAAASATGAVVNVVAAIDACARLPQHTQT
jgi:hypothetical protein